MNSRRLFGLVGALALSLLWAGTAWAQGVSTLRGSVTDPTGAVVPGAEVTLTNEATGGSRSTTTAADGAYVFTLVAPGEYTVRVARQGFRTAVQHGVEVLVATPATLNVKLEVGAVTETVEVEAARTGLNTLDATMGDTFGELQVKQLPFSARNPVAMLTLQPGVVFTGESDIDLLSMGSTADLEERDGVVNGVRSNQSNITLDGVDVNDPQQQAAFLSAIPVSLDSLQEFRVVTSNANPTEGVAAGAQVQLITKSGSNNIHGNVRWFHRNDATAANLFFNKAAAGGEVPTPKNIRNQFGFSVGGPFVKERAFFFADWEQRRDNTESAELRDVPSDTLKQGIFQYETTAGGVQTLTAADIAALDAAIGTDPALTGAPLGINPAMLAYMALFPSGNSPLEARDNGLNFNVLRFNAPITIRNNVYALRFDFNLDRAGKHKAFWRGNLGDVKTGLLTPPQFPGQPPAGVFLNNGKGFATSYTAQFRPNLINTFTWGFTRAGVSQTGRDGDSFIVRSYSTNTSFTRAFGRKIPNHNFRDDITWIRGRHTVQAGTNVILPRNKRFTKAISFGQWTVNNGFCANLCRDPARALVANGFPAAADITTFVRSFMMLTGSLTQVNATFFVDPATVSFLPFGTPQAREFAENDFEFYVQDSWRIRPTLTLSAGLRYSYFGPVWEKDGFQVRPTVDVRDWWNQRLAAAEAGLPTDSVAPLEFVLAGKANDAPGWYDPDKNNFAPRAALAWSPSFDSGIGNFLFGSGGKSVFRLGGGVFFHRVGGALAASNDVNGSPGLSNGLLSPVAQFGIQDAPRFTGTCSFSGCSGFPALSTFVTTPTATFPATPGLLTDNVSFMLDNNLSTPYSFNLNLSFQREVKGITFESAYVGTFGRQLLTKTDFSQMMWNFRDPASGATLEQAFNGVVDLLRAGFDPFTTAPTPIPFIENVFSNMCFEYGFLLDAPCANNTMAFTALAFFFDPSWTDMIFLLDVNDPLDGFCAINISLDPECFGAGGSGVPGRTFFQQQFNTLRGWVNWGSSNYHSWQLSARRGVGNFVFNANYVLSKSIDNGSAPENADLFAPLGEFAGSIPNPLRPKAHRAVSDFDLRHNFNANWVAQLPFGRGRFIGTDASGVLEHLIGNWQLSGTWRWRSGFPLSPGNGFNFPTNFFLTGPGTATGPLNSNVTSNAQGNRGPNLFRNPDAAFNLVTFTRPAAIGSRNIVRSDDYFSVDLGIGKTFRLGEKARLQFRWEVFNLFNNVNFDSDDVDLDPESPGTFGQFFSTAGGFPQQGAREMQFVLRIDF